MNSEVKDASNTQGRLIPLRLIRPYDKQPRRFFSLSALKTLRESIQEEGQKEAGIVRPLNPPVDGYEFELIDGERRFRACLLAGLSTYKAIVDTTPMTEEEQFIRSLMANVNREGHTTTEMAMAIKRMKEEMRYPDDKIARILGKSVLWVTQHYSLLRLRPEVFALMEPDIPEEKRLLFTTAIILVSVPENYQIELAETISRQGLTTSQAKNLIKKTLNKAGVKSRFRRPDKEYKAFAGFIVRTKEQLEVFLEMSNPQFREMLRGSKLQERMRVFEILDEIIKDVPALEKEITKLFALDGDQQLRERAQTVKMLGELARLFPQVKGKIDIIMRDRENVK